MRKLLTLITLSLVNFGMAQWTYFPGSTPMLLQNEMTFLDQDLGFMVGTNALPNGNAIIARSNDGGYSWSTVYSMAPVTTPTTLMMNDIQFVDQDHGYACGGYIDPYKGIIVHSSNGGTTWDTISHDLNDQSKFLAVHFFDTANGLIAGNGLWRTTNGGLNWTPVTLPAGVTDLNDLHFVNALLGFGVANTSSNLIRTTDGGNTWTLVTLPTTEQANEVTFYDENNGLLACEEGVILYTTNGGLNWIAGTNSDPDLRDVQCVEMTSASVGFAGTTGGNILHTTNSGASWIFDIDVSTLSPSLLIASIYDLAFPAPELGLGCGNLLGGIVLTDNGGGVIGINELFIEPLKLVPNPAFDRISYGTEPVSSVQLFSAYGQLVAQFAGSELNGVLYVGDISPGTYIIRTVAENSVREGLFIKE